MKDYLYKLFCGTNAEFVTKKTVTVLSTLMAFGVQFMILAKQPQYLIHSLCIWLFFILVVLGIVALEKINLQGLLNKFTKTEEPKEPVINVNPKTL
jgi:hypothetical protein